MYNYYLFIYLIAEISAAISCASLALIDTGMELYDIIGSCTVGVLNNQFIIDPSNIEILNCNATITVGYMKSMNVYIYYNLIILYCIANYILFSRRNFII